ncbi:1-deoxy-D-xylulose-5-phosphate synthase [uncultured archaeon]|nr:1-deoxy-D-xylulose-5-phosphate synthase [uncultured archaeon]
MVEFNEKLFLRKDFLENPVKESVRDSFGKTLVALGKKNKNIYAVSGDLAESTRAIYFKETFPERFVEVGVAEQNLMGVACGISLMNKIPFACSFAVFSPGRNWDQLRVSGCYSGNNVKVIGAHAGLNVGQDGATHEALEDLAITRVLPNLNVLVPSDAMEARKATIAMAKHKGMDYMRFGRVDYVSYTTEKTPFQIGKANVLIKNGKDACIIACGLMVYEAIKAAMILEEKGVRVSVINNSSVKPLDEQTILEETKKVPLVITAEEHQVTGGLGSAIAELLSQKQPKKMGFIGVQNTFGESGKPEELFEKYGLTSKNIVNKILKLTE